MTLERRLVQLANVALFLSLAVDVALCQSYGLEGDFVVGLVLPIHETNETITVPYDDRYACGDLNSAQAMRVSQFRRWLVDVNENQKILPGYKVGFSVVDSCSLPSIAIQRTSQWAFEKITKVTAGIEEGASPVTLAIGAYSSRVSEPLTTYLQLYDILLADFGATSSSLSDRLRYPLYVRTSPSDKFQAEALISVVKKNGYNCTHLIYSRGLYGENGADDIRKQMASNDLCIASDRRAPTLINDATTSEFAKLVADLQQQPNAAAIICFCEDTTIIGLLSALNDARIIKPDSPKFVIMASDYWGNSLSVIGLESVSEGAITLTLGSGDSSKFPDDGSWFSEQLQNRNQQDPWFSEYLESRFHCTFNLNNTRSMPCNIEDMNLSPSDLPQDDDASYHFRSAFHASIHALNDMVTAECGDKTKVKCINHVNVNTRRLYSYLRNTTFTSEHGTPFSFDPNGDGHPDYELYNYRRLGTGLFFLNRYTYAKLGSWSLGSGLQLTEADNYKRAIYWPGSNNVTIKSFCECDKIGAPKDADSTSSC